MAQTIDTVEVKVVANTSKFDDQLAALKKRISNASFNIKIGAIDNVQTQLNNLNQQLVEIHNRGNITGEVLGNLFTRQAVTSGLDNFTKRLDESKNSLKDIGELKTPEDIINSFERATKGSAEESLILHRLAEYYKSKFRISKKAKEILPKEKVLWNIQPLFTMKEFAKPKIPKIPNNQIEKLIQRTIPSPVKVSPRLALFLKRNNIDVKGGYVAEQVISKKLANEMKKAKIPMPKGMKVEKKGMGLLSFSKLTAGVAVAAAAVYAIQRSVQGLVRTADEASNSLQIIANLEAVLNSTGNAAGKTSQELQDTAQQLSKLTNFSDEQIMSSQALLATFTNIKGTTFDKAIESAADLSQIFGVDIAGATRQIGRALNQPISGMRILSRYGINFTKEEQAKINKLLETNNVLAAQEIILGKINAKVGGAAKEAANPLTQIKNLFGEVRERIGQVVIDSIGLGDGWRNIKNYIDNAVKAFDNFRKTQEYIKLMAQLQFIMKSIWIIVGAVGNILFVIFSRIAKIVTGLIGFIADLFNIIMPGLSEFTRSLSEGLSDIPILNDIAKIADITVGALKDISKAKQDMDKQMADGLPEFIKKQTKANIEAGKEELVQLQKKKDKVKEIKSEFETMDAPGFWDTMLKSWNNILDIGKNKGIDIFGVGANIPLESPDFGKFKTDFNLLPEDGDDVIEAIEDGTNQEESDMKVNNDLLGKIYAEGGVFA